MNKRLYFIIFMLVCKCVVSNAQTNVSGFISANTTWDLAGSPYIITGNALVTHGYTLTVNPGVIIKFNTDKALQIDGELIAIGTPENRIVFTSNQVSPVAGDWAKIHFADTCVDAVFNVSGDYVSGSIMKYCDVLYGGGLGFGEIHIDRSSPYFSRCRIMNSSSSGIYCFGSTYLLDSSAVKNCLDYALYFNAFTQTSCDLIIQSDTIENNEGGIYLSGVSNASCQKRIHHNYFLSNTVSNTIFTPSIQNLIISENYFYNNSAQGNNGIIAFQNSSGFSIECNKFINNHTQGTGVINAACNAVIQRNIFDGNTSTGGVSVVDLQAASSSLHFTNNIIKNNSSTSGSCCTFSPQFTVNAPLMVVDYNQFSNNTGQSIVRIVNAYQNTNPAFYCLYLKHNNFSDPNMIEVYNNVAYGSPNIYADSNYWSSTSTQYVASAIYDYFDFANQSVVYYLPILNAAATIDTICPFISTGINSSEATLSTFTLFPNPAATQFTVAFDKTIQKGTLEIYNLLGERVFLEAIYHVSKKEIPLQSISNGIYLVKIFDGERSYSKKIIVGRN